MTELHQRPHLYSQVEPEPEPLPLGIRPFDSAAYHPQTHVLPPGGIRHFRAFARRAPEDLLL